MAEAIARRLASARGMADLEIGSAGTGAVSGTPASDGALLVALEHGLDLGSHRSRLATREIIADADLVLTMGESHAQRIAEMGGGGRVSVLPDYATSGAVRENVSDPFGANLEVYRRTFAELERYVELALGRLASERTPD